MWISKGGVWCNTTWNLSVNSNHYHTCIRRGYPSNIGFQYRWIHSLGAIWLVRQWTGHIWPTWTVRSCVPQLPPGPEVLFPNFCYDGIWIRSGRWWTMRHAHHLSIRVSCVRYCLLYGYGFSSHHWIQSGLYGYPEQRKGPFSSILRVLPGYCLFSCDIFYSSMLI